MNGHARHDRTGKRSGDIRTGVILGVLAVKFLLATAFVLYLFQYLSVDRLSPMPDQVLYLNDIAMIEHDLSTLFGADDLYAANRTLFSRVAGFVSWVIPSRQEPIIAALYANALFHALIALSAARLYQYMGGTRATMVFVIIAFSPTLSVYSAFALRDVMITLFMTTFVTAVLTTRFPWVLGSALTSLVAMLFLRPFFLAVMAFFWLAVFLGGRVRQATYPRVSATASLLILVVLAVLADRYLAPDAVEAYYRERFDIVRLLLASTGLESIFSSAEGVMVDRSTIRAVRLLMVDSVIIPPLLVVVCAAALLQRHYRYAFLSGLVFACAIFVSFTYLSVTDRFAFRKLMPLLPVMWVAVILELERRWPSRSRRRGRRRKTRSGSSSNISPKSA